MGKYEVILVAAVVSVLFLARQLANGVGGLKEQSQEVRSIFLGLAVIFGSILILVLFYAFKHAP